MKANIIAYYPIGPCGPVACGLGLGVFAVSQVPAMVYSGFMEGLSRASNRL